jgi:hypothetical protein
MGDAPKNDLLNQFLSTFHAIGAAHARKAGQFAPDLRNQAMQALIAES